MVDFASNILKMITPGQPGGVAYAQKEFSEFDRNSDGAIAASEFLKVFATLEITKDRAPPGSSGIAPTYYLRPTLFDVTLFPSYGRNYAISLYQAQAMLGALDGDGDNSVSLAEMTAHAAGPTPPDPDDAVPPAEEIGPPQGRMPCDRRAPVVADDDRFRFAAILFADRLHQFGHVAHQVEQRVLVDRLGRFGATVAAHVGRHAAEARGADRLQLMPPRIPALRPAVREQHQGAAAGFGVAHMDVVGFGRLERDAGNWRSGHLDYPRR